MGIQTGVWTNKSPVFYRTSSPLGLLPCLSFRFTIMQSRATGIADQILPLDDLFIDKLNPAITDDKE